MPISYWLMASMGRMHDADVSASLRLKLTYDGLAHYVGMQNDVLALVRVLRPVVAYSLPRDQA